MGKVDVLRPLKEADSLERRTTSGTERLEDVLGGVDVAIMRDTTARTRPRSYPQGTQSTRAGALATARASDTGERFTA